MKSKILHIIEWIFAVLGLIISVVMIASGGKGLISGLVFLISALVISPVFEKIPLLTDKPKNRTVLQFVSSFIIFVIAFFLVPTNPDTENKSTSDVSVASTTTATNITDEVTTTTKKTTIPVTTSSFSETTQTTTTSATTSTTRTTSCTTSTTTSTTRTTNSTTSITNSATSISTSTTRNTTSTTITQANNYIRNEELQGRGMADVGRSEPDYIGVIGYTAISSSKEFELSKNDNFTDKSLWSIPTFEKDKQFWNETSYALPHKTEVAVLEQDLKHEGYGAYSGYLLVQKLDDNKKYYIDVSNFVTKPYWDYSDNLKDAALTGMFIAEYNQRSDYYPVHNGGDKAEIPNGTIVLVTGVAGHSRYIYSPLLQHRQKSGIMKEGEKDGSETKNKNRIE